MSASLTQWPPPKSNPRRQGEDGRPSPFPQEGTAEGQSWLFSEACSALEPAAARSSEHSPSERAATEVGSRRRSLAEGGTGDPQGQDSRGALSLDETPLHRPELAQSSEQTADPLDEVRRPERPPMLLRRREFRGDGVSLPAAGPARPETESFRRRGVISIHRRQRRFLAWAKGLLTALVLVGVPALLALWILSSPRFALAEVTVVASDRVEADWVQGALAPLQGENLPTLSLSRARDLLHGHPWIDRVTLQKRLPRELSVVVSQREPQAVVIGELEAVYIDGRGAIAPVEGEPPQDLPVITGLNGREDLRVAALAVVAEARAQDSAALGSLERIEAIASQDLLAVFSALPFPLRVQPGALPQRQPALLRLLPELLLRSEEIRVVDLRFDGRLIVETMEFGGDEPPRPGIRRGSRG
ncbi:MAG: FtsQ-type POTRA domain-containing protein [Acidobacteriota bacterium]